MLAINLASKNFYSVPLRINWCPEKFRLGEIVHVLLSDMVSSTGVDFEGLLMANELYLKTNIGCWGTPGDQGISAIVLPVQREPDHDVNGSCPPS